MKKNFYVKRIPKVESNHTYLVVINLDTALIRDAKYYLQGVLKQRKYTEKNVIRHLNDNLSEFFFLMILMKNKLELNLF